MGAPLRELEPPGSSPTPLPPSEPPLKVGTADLWLTTVVSAPFGATLASMAAAAPVAGGLRPSSGRPGSSLSSSRSASVPCLHRFPARRIHRHDLRRRVGHGPHDGPVRRGLAAGRRGARGLVRAVRAVGACSSRQARSGSLLTGPGGRVDRASSGDRHPRHAVLPVALFGVVGAVSGRRLRTVRLVAMAVGVLSAGLAVVDDPFLDPVCWPTCSDSALLISSQPVLAEVLERGPGRGLGRGRRTGVVRCGASVARGVGRRPSLERHALRWARRGRCRRSGVRRRRTGRDRDRRRPRFLGLHVGRAAAWSLLAAAAIWTTQRHCPAAGRWPVWPRTWRPPVVRDRWPAPCGRSPVTRSWTCGTRSAPTSGRWADGRTVGDHLRPGRIATPLRRGDRTSPSSCTTPRCCRSLPWTRCSDRPRDWPWTTSDSRRNGSRGRTTSESQRRIVRTGDEARRRLERDLTTARSRACWRCPSGCA